MIDPRGFSVVEWVERSTLDLAAFGTVPRIRGEEHWKEWASAVTQLPAVSAKNPPSPDPFEDWRQWAFFFNQCVFS